MTKKERETASSIPEFKSREEEAEWFDSHDMADYQDEFNAAKVRFGKHLSDTLNIRLDRETLDALREEAQEQGIGPTTLARIWIREHVRELKRKAHLRSQSA